MNAVSITESDDIFIRVPIVMPKLVSILLRGVLRAMPQRAVKKGRGQRRNRRNRR